MTAETTRTTQHDCADHGCLAAMLGVELTEATAGNTDTTAPSSW